MGSCLRRNGDPVMTAEPLSPAELEAALKQIGAERYHSLHPFHKLMYQGRVESRSASGMGFEPLLLPVPYSRRKTRL